MPNLYLIYRLAWITNHMVICIYSTSVSYNLQVFHMFLRRCVMWEIVSVGHFSKT
jgi:hypothetical protein